MMRSGLVGLVGGLVTTLMPRLWAAWSVGAERTVDEDQDGAICGDASFVEWEAGWADSWTEDVVRSLDAVLPVSDTPAARDRDRGAEDQVSAALVRLGPSHVVGVDCAPQGCLAVLASLDAALPEILAVGAAVRPFGLGADLIERGSFDARGASRGTMQPATGDYELVDLRSADAQLHPEEIGARRLALLQHLRLGLADPPPGK